MDDYVAKPIRPDQLARALARARRLPATGDPAADAGPALDVAALDSLRELGGDAFLTEVIDTFCADAPSLLALLRSSLDAGDTAELRRAAHTLKSNGSTLGADAFAELCRTLEQRARNGELTGAADLVDRIEKAYGPLREALARLRSKAPA
jgi:HPt (histidine-containing phosphotransfer) domain-containing protein